MIRGSERSAWAFIAFPLTIIFLFTALPTVLGIGLSFFQWNGGEAMRFIGIANYRELIASSAFWPALRNTLLFAVITVPITVLGAFLIAVAVNSPWFRAKTVARTVLFLPTVVSIVAIGFIWRWILDPGPSGLLNNAMAIFGLRRDAMPDWLGNSPWALVAVMTISIWRQLGFCVVLYLAALSSVPRSLYDAAAVDGASGWRTMWNVTWPSVRPMTYFLLLTGMIGALQVFDILVVMVGTSQQSWTDVLNLFLYREFSLNRLGFAATIGVVILLLTIVITLLQVRWLNRRGRMAA